MASIFKRDTAFPSYRTMNGCDYEIADGLSKREHAAIQIMQGLVSNLGSMECEWAQITAKAVKYADALIAELAKPKGGEQ